MIAWVNGFIGLGATLFIGSRYLGLAIGELLVIAAKVGFGGGVAVVLAAEAQAAERIRRHLLRGPLGSWIFFLGCYFGTMLGLASPLREGKVFWPLIVPLILVNGFTIVAFGPYQDWRVAGRQRRARTGQDELALPPKLS